MASNTPQNCTQCPRLVTFLQQVKVAHPDYYCQPVLPFGAERPRLFIVGLAPGMHGANATGRAFTGDYAGVLLYSTLYQFGFATRPESISADDGLQLIHCRISNAVKCLPPANKPLPVEIKTCNVYLREELQALPPTTAILTLGSIAHQATLMAFGMKPSAAKFKHAEVHRLPSGHTLFNSYHCSRYNTNTRRLTEQSFHDVFRLIQQHLSAQSL
ncbi:MAG: uracil-DNA glycosylase [Betaproteobacteria bacterium]|nr:uracil-DNA glycosylase [Betaproteobacteria bacterium]